MSDPRNNGKSEKSLAEFIDEFIEWADSLEDTPVDYVEAAKLLRKNRKECAEWLKGKETFWILSEEGADDGTDQP